MHNVFEQVAAEAGFNSCCAFSGLGGNASIGIASTPSPPAQVAPGVEAQPDQHPAPTGTQPEADAPPKDEPKKDSPEKKTMLRRVVKIGGITLAVIAVIAGARYLFFKKN